MRRLTYARQLEPLLRVPLFTAEEAKKRGIPRRALAYLVKKGILEKIHVGTYRCYAYEPKVECQWDNLALIAASIPRGVICLTSALCYHDLTDQVMREIWIAVPYETYPPKRPNTRIIRMRNMDLGKTRISLGEYRVQIFDKERCIVDAFRYLSKEIAELLSQDDCDMKDVVQSSYIKNLNVIPSVNSPSVAEYKLAQMCNNGL